MHYAGTVNTVSANASERILQTARVQVLYTISSKVSVFTFYTISALSGAMLVNSTMYTEIARVSELTVHDVSSLSVELH